MVLKTAIKRALNNSPQAMQGRAFHHYVAPVRPPTGTYDPALDAQAGQSTRGYQDLQADTSKNLERGQNDYLIGNAERSYQSGNTLGDIVRQQLQTQQDAAIGTAERQRQYGLQAQQQSQRANAAGVLGASGWNEQAQGIRGANQAREQAASDLALQRANTGYGIQTDRATHDAAFNQGQADTAWGRATQDAQTQLGRAGRENTFFGADTNAERLFQATTSGGWVPPVQPANEHRIAGIGQYFQRTPHGITLENGRALTVAQWKALRRQTLAERSTGKAA